MAIDVDMRGTGLAPNAAGLRATLPAEVAKIKIENDYYVWYIGPAEACREARDVRCGEHESRPAEMFPEGP